MRIGLTLSGGGIRAAAFHLGVLARLARQSLLEDIAFVSTVSGGSLAIALVRACSGNSWPDSATFLQHTIPEARHHLTTRSLKHAYVRHLILFPWALRRGRAAAMAAALKHCWSVTESLSDLPDNPRWIINATCYETGKNWRFMKKRMGDYVTGYVSSPRLPIAEAVAASSAFPGLVGALKLDTARFQWFAVRQGTRTERPVPKVQHCHAMGWRRL